jgi:spermidine/putrescine transport system substrate-binding protein
LIDGNFHIVKPRNTPVALDMMVINKKDNNSSKKNAVYDILYKILLEGCNLPWKISENTPDLEWIGATNQDDEFVCGPTLNFDYVSYTPTLWNLNKFVAREEEDPNEYNSYFDMMYDDHNKAELLAEINNVNFKPTDGGLLELPLSNLAKSNMSFVYMQYKEKL